MSRTRKSKQGRELWSRRASAAAVNGWRNGVIAKRVTNHKERRKAHVEAAQATREG